VQTQDQGFTVDHPIVGQNTGTWERNVFKINEPGEAVQNNGLNKLGGLTNSVLQGISPDAGTTPANYIYEDCTSIANLPIVGQKLTAVQEYKITNRFTCLDALDYCPSNNSSGTFYTLEKTTPSIASVRSNSWDGEKLTFGKTVAAQVFTVPAGENIITGCLVRRNSTTGYNAAILCTVTGLSGANTIKLYYMTTSSNTLISQVDSTLFDISPHCNAWENGGRVIVQSPIFDANGPQYAWSTTTPTTAVSWAQLAYSAWLVGVTKDTVSTLGLFGTERTTAGRAQVGATISITSAGVLTETAVVPEVGYAQGANAFNGPGFYTSLFTDTAGGASIQAMTGNFALNVNTQATGAGITETVLPDGVGVFAGSGIGKTTPTIKIKVANKSPAVLTIADSIIDPGAVISEFGKFDLSYCPSIQYYDATSGVIFYAIGNGAFDCVQYAAQALNDYVIDDTRIDYNVFLANYGSANNLVDMNKGVVDFNFGSFVRCCTAYQTQFSTGIGANTINFQPGNQYTTGVYLGAYTGVASTALPNRVDWLEYYPNVYAYHSAYTNGTGREYVPGQDSLGTAIETQLKFLDTRYLDITGPSFVQNNNLPVPAGCRIEDGIITLPTGIAQQARNISDTDGDAAGFCGYALTSFLATDIEPFVIQGQLYGYDGREVYAIEQGIDSLNTPDRVLRAEGHRLLATSTDGAFFYNTFEGSVAFFDGGRSFQPVFSLAGLLGVTTVNFQLIGGGNGYGNSGVQRMAIYNYNLDSLFIRLITDNDNYWLRHSRMGRTIHILTTDNSAMLVKNRAKAPVFVNRDSGSASNRVIWYTNLYQPNENPSLAVIQTLNYQSPYYGIEEGNYVRVLKYIFMLKVTAPTTTDLVVTFKWFTYDSSGAETYTFLANTYTSNNGYVYLEYIPTQQVGHGVSIGLSSTKEVYILGITGHYGQPELALSVNQNVSTS
jgi:hypothetical protein